ncbi:MAG TPA: hypothetical protein VNA20_05370 [Frankiaceae bacterium]|nr:hypothetical protein [Frankiaceae bacterium]
MITKLRVLIVAVALAAAGTGSASAKSAADACGAFATQADVVDALVAAAKAGVAEDVSAVLRCAAAPKDDEADPPICAVLKLFAGRWFGVVVITSQGDVYVNGAPLYECPPYDTGGRG